jgi:broad specificity phosphatase PhoE
MAKLYLVRHAQASFGMENYDQLSELGYKQSAYIPKHFEDSLHHEINAFYRGDMLRHQQTAEHSFTGKDMAVIPGLNEFNHESVLKVHRPEIADREKAMALIVAQSDPKKFMEDEFDLAMNKWMDEEGASAYAESFKHFKERCLASLDEIISTSRKEKHKEVVAITSGGVISLLVAHILDLPQSKYTGLNTIIANTSVTCLLFNDHKITLRYFNNYSHLPKEMVTFF